MKTLTLFFVSLSVVFLSGCGTVLKETIVSSSPDKKGTVYVDATRYELFGQKRVVTSRTRINVTNLASGSVEVRMGSSTVAFVAQNETKTVIPPESPFRDGGDNFAVVLFKKDAKDNSFIALYSDRYIETGRGAVTASVVVTNNNANWNIHRPSYGYGYAYGY